jgi:enamine deaminase RidA (YjgF/YER057c/UK114 family)
MKKETYSSNAPWEKVIGYYRAIKIGNDVEVAGTTAINEDGLIMGNDYFTQTKYILEKIEKALQSFNFTKKDIIRTRIFVIDIKQWEDVARAHKEFFGEIVAVNTLIEVSKFIQEELLVEIEVTAKKI